MNKHIRDQNIEFQVNSKEIERLIKIFFEFLEIKSNEIL